MRPALKAALDRVRALLLAAVAGSSSQLAGYAQAAVNPADQQVVSAEEQKAWAQAQAKRTAEAYQRYLELFPTGQYAEQAFRLLIERSLKGRPARTLVDTDPPARPGGSPRQRSVAVAALALY